jgi:ribonuclease-3
MISSSRLANLRLDPDDNMNKPARLQRILGYEFSDPDLLGLALAHRSVGNRNNERLEFLGDSIVNHVIAEALYEKFPQAREGELSRLRASLVKGETLAELARELNLGEYLELGPGEKKSGGHRRATILADAFEAIAGAILLDSDVERCRSILLQYFSSRLDALDSAVTEKDPKTRLQEFLQGRGRPLPEYSLVQVTGDDHHQHFEISCKLAKPQKNYGGHGSSRRKAEQAAATAALTELEANA